MVSTLAAVAAAILLAAALLDRLTVRALVLTAVAAGLPDVDAILAVVDPGLHNAALHNVWIPLAAGVLLRSRRLGLRERFTATERRLAWTLVVAYGIAVAFDLFNVESAAVLWPVHDRFFAVYGRLAYSTTDGLVFTFLDPQLGGGELLPKAGRGTVTGDYAVSSPFVSDTDQRASAVLVNAGWELLLALVAAVVSIVRLSERGDR